MREWQSDRLLFLDNDSSPRPRARGSRANTWAAALFLLVIVLALGSALYLLAAWHALRMH